ncbi:Uncharacterised protein [Mycobacteroides abscessus subsp. abscessus]|nr:Uncharacterised protein [Mycobacteroides abscessus subsp. abscessus]
MIARKHLASTGHAGSHEGRTVDRCEHASPRCPSGVGIGERDAARMIAEVATTGLCPGVGRPGRVEREQVGEDERTRPSVDQNVVIGDDQVRVVAVAEEREAHQRGGLEIESTTSLHVGVALHRRLVISRHVITGRRRRYLDDLPRHGDRLRDHRDHGAAPATHERRAQRPVMIEECFCRTTKPLDVDVPAEVEDSLHHVDIDRVVAREL